MNSAPRRQRRQPARLLLSLADDVSDGATIVEALADEARAKGKYGRFQPVVGRLAARARQGLSLRQLFGEYPQHFPEPVVAKLAEADRGGGLAEKLAQAANLFGEKENTKRRGLVSRFRGLGRVRKALAALVAVAAGIAAIWGGVKAVEEAVDQIKKWRSEPTELIRSSHLALQVWQGGTEDKMFFDDDRMNDAVRVPMKSRPFTLRFPKLPRNVGMALTAWTNDSIYVVREGNPERTAPFLGPGRGMADTEYGSGSMTLTNEAHNYFIGDRIARASSTDDGVFVSTISEGIPEAKRTPWGAQTRSAPMRRGSRGTGSVALPVCGGRLCSCRLCTSSLAGCLS